MLPPIIWTGLLVLGTICVLSVVILIRWTPLRHLLRKKWRRYTDDCSIGSWKSNSFTGVWPSSEYDGDTHINLPEMWLYKGLHVPRYPKLFDSQVLSWGRPGRRGIRSNVRWYNVTISMLELQDKAEKSAVTMVMI